MNKNKQSFWYMGTALAMAMLISACGGSDGSDGEPGPAGPQGELGAQGGQGPAGEPAGPVISNISVLGSPIYPGGQVQIYVSAYSPTDQPLSYSWEAPADWEGTDFGDNTLVVTAPDKQAATATAVAAPVLMPGGVVGNERWSFATGNAVISSPAVGADGTVYVDSNDSNVYAIE